MTQKRISRRLKHDISCWLMILAPLVGFLLFGFVPMIISLYSGFTSFVGYKFQDATFVGFQNYKAVLTDPLFHKSIGNTFYALLTLPLQLLIGLTIATVLSQDMVKFKKGLRAIYFIPYICSSVAVSTVFVTMFDSTSNGVINSMLNLIGIESQPFFTSESQFMPCVILMMCWQGVGYYTLMYQAALTGIDKSIVEAAKLDGAGPFCRFLHITLPGVSPTTFYMLVMGMIGGLQNFGIFRTITGAVSTADKFGPNNAGITMMFYLYDRGINNLTVPGMGMGLASATAWVIVVGVMILTGINFLVSKRWVHYDS